MTPRSLTELDKVVEELGRQLEGRGQRARGTVRTIWLSLRERLEVCLVDPEGRYVLADEGLLDLATALERQYSSKAHRWLAKHTLNLVMFKLEKEGALATQYLNVPHQVPRTLVTTLDGISPTMLAAARHIRQVLQDTPTIEPPEHWRWGMAVWRLLVFYTSVVLHSCVLLPKLMQRLLNLRCPDLSERGWLQLPQRGRREDVEQGLRPLLRFPLARCSAQHLAKLLGAVEQPRTGSRRTKNPVFPDDWRSAKWRQRILAPAWEDFMSQLTTNITVSSSVMDMDTLIHIGTVLALMDDLPPFAVAVHTGQTPVSPMTDASFHRLFLLKEWRDSETEASRRSRTNPRQLATSHGEDGELFQEIELARLSLRREERDARSIRRGIADRISQLIGVTEELLVGRVGEFTALGYNVRCYGLWLIRLLWGKDDNGTVATRASAIAAGFFPYCIESPFCTWSVADWVSNMATVMEDHETSHAKASFRRFYDFLVETRLAPKMDIPWQARALTKPAIRNPVPLVGLEEFDQALAGSSSDIIPARLDPLIRVKMIFGFDLGLRSMEATNLMLTHYKSYPEPVLEIRITKTASGIRNLYLSKLMPAHHLNEVQDFVDQRYREARGNLEVPLLATPEHPEPYDSSYLASLVGLLLREVIDEPLCFHHLRHSFASWFLLRWLKAVKGIDCHAMKAPLWTHEVFQEPLLSGLRQLLFGLRESKIGEIEFSHGLVVLCRLLGHSNPATTLSAYCHTLDILSNLIVNQGRN